jgi:hypothetical protein
MEFKTYQKIVHVKAAEIVIPDDIKELVRKKQPQTYHGAKVRYNAEHGDEPELFQLLHRQDTSEVLLEEGDYFVETPTGLKGVKKEAFEEEYGLLDDAETVASEKKSKKK